MTVYSGKADGLSVAFAGEKVDLGKSLGQSIPQNRDYRRLSAEVIAIDQINAQLLRTEKLMVFYT